MDIELPHRTPWGTFPDVLILAAESPVKHHPDYPGAKAGDVALKAAKATGKK